MPLSWKLFFMSQSFDLVFWWQCYTSISMHMATHMLWITFLYTSVCVSGYIFSDFFVDLSFSNCSLNVGVHKLTCWPLTTMLLLSNNHSHCFSNNSWIYILYPYCSEVQFCSYQLDISKLFLFLHILFTPKLVYFGLKIVYR